MTKIASKGRTVLAGLLTASVLGLAMAPSAAYAGHRHHHGFGVGAAALGGGLLLGALIASQPRPVYYERRCWTEKRRVYIGDGLRHYRYVTVCN